VKFNEGEYPGDDAMDMAQLESLSGFTSVSDFLSGWLDKPYWPNGGDAAELQLDALHLAAQDMNAYSTAENPNRYIVLITDNVFHYLNDGSGTNTTMTKAGVTEELTSSGCRVYISLWEGYLQLQDTYDGLQVNGEFDPVDYEAEELAGIYPLARLRARIMADWP